MRRFFLRGWNVLRGERGDGDLARELRAHRALLEDEFARQGMTRDEARTAARRALGSTALVADLHRDARLSGSEGRSTAEKSSDRSR